MVEYLGEHTLSHRIPHPGDLSAAWTPAASETNTRELRKFAQTGASASWDMSLAEKALEEAEGNLRAVVASAGSCQAGECATGMWALPEEERRALMVQSDESSEEEQVQWVQCDKCSKWRRIPAEDILPEGATWECSQNPDTLYKTCEADQEEVGDSLSSESGSDEEEDNQVLKPKPKQRPKSDKVPDRQAYLEYVLSDKDLELCKSLEKRLLSLGTGEGEPGHDKLARQCAEYGLEYEADLTTTVTKLLKYKRYAAAAKTKQQPESGTVSYTHLTLPTKRIV
eukprot:TRINITY_DN11623_c0_g1_i3.p1 TRINITY_DN11623_c0_g1~~TRINITY_DN11623_c0_g1_i3.p1  ORF type:complete len:283 (+),score=74.34 TRINITY_DN11623_c0_g1_i3:394-1242(+)